MITRIQTDALIIGGGIAGLWLLNRLRAEGYDALLMEQDCLGKGQSIASQGMIHGGIKYTLDGSLNSASQAIADMPAHWQACLQGKGDVDLRGTNVLSEEYYMWPNNSLRSRFNAFLGSKVVRGKVEPVAKNELPVFFQNKISGPLYRLNDIVLDVPSLLTTLSQNQSSYIRKINWQQAKFIRDDNGAISSLVIDIDKQGIIEIQAQRYLFTCGAGTQTLLKDFKLEQKTFAMQLRPLQMVMLKHKIPHPIYVHCVAEQLTATLDLTITSHRCADGDWVWYLGGALAEAGATRSVNQQIIAAQQKLRELFPWCDFSKAEWKTIFIDRAEEKQDNGKRPEHSSLISQANLCVCWPTKLTLTPTLANQLITLFKNQGVYPEKGCNKSDYSLFLKLPYPEIASTPWDDMST